jgi:hypothetical protein
VIRRLLCLTFAHRWHTSWDYFAGVVHIRARCLRCDTSRFEAVDLVRAGAAPDCGVGVEYESAHGRVGPIIWNDQSTWSSGGEVPAALLTYRAF